MSKNIYYLPNAPFLTAANVPYFWQICLGNELYPLLEALEYEKIRFILSLYIAYLKQSNLEVNMIRETMETNHYLF